MLNIESGEWSKLVRSAIEDHSLVIFCQPMESLSGSSGVSEFSEVLMRLQVGDELIPAGKFIDAISEDSALIWACDRYVVEASLAKIRTQPNHVHAVNLSLPTLEDLTFPQFAIDMVSRHGCRIDQLCFEVTEYHQLTERAIATIRALKGLGFWVGVDDFGTGYNGLATAIRVKPNFLKVAGEIVEGLASDDQWSIHVISGILYAAYWLRIPVVAERVADNHIKRQLDDIRKRVAPAVDLLAQGWGIGEERQC